MSKTLLCISANRHHQHMGAELRRLGSPVLSSVETGVPATDGVVCESFLRYQPLEGDQIHFVVLSLPSLCWHIATLPVCWQEPALGAVSWQEALGILANATSGQDQDKQHGPVSQFLLSFPCQHYPSLPPLFSPSLSSG